MPGAGTTSSPAASTLLKLAARFEGLAAGALSPISRAGPLQTTMGNTDLFLDLNEATRSLAEVHNNRADVVVESNAAWLLCTIVMVLVIAWASCHILFSDLARQKRQGGNGKARGIAALKPNAPFTADARKPGGKPGAQAQGAKPGAPLLHGYGLSTPSEPIGPLSPLKRNPGSASTDSLRMPVNVRPPSYKPPRKTAPRSPSSKPISPSTSPLRATAWSPAGSKSPSCVDSDATWDSQPRAPWSDTPMKRVDVGWDPPLLVLPYSELPQVHIGEFGRSVLKTDWEMPRVDELVDATSSEETGGSKKCR